MTGLDVLRRLGTGIKTKTILLGADIQRSDELTAILLGASGVVGKYSASETLFRSIRVVMEGEMWVKREVIAELIGMLRGREGTPGDALGHFGLTDDSELRMLIEEFAEALPEDCVVVND